MYYAKCVGADFSFRKSAPYVKNIKKDNTTINMLFSSKSSIYMMAVMPTCCKVLEVLSVLICILGGEEVRKIEKIQVQIAGRA